MDDAEEATNRNRTSVPKDHLVLYQFSARGHDMAQCILASRLDHSHDAVSAYYRSRPLLLALGLSIDDGFASPLGRADGFSDGRDIGVVCNLPREKGPIVLPMSGDVGSQFTPAAGWAQAITYHREVLRDRTWRGAIATVLGGEASIATNGFWSCLTIATTLKLPLLFYVEDNGLGISVRGGMQTPGGNIAANLASFANLFIRDGDGTDPGAAAALVDEVVAHVRGGNGPALLRSPCPGFRAIPGRTTRRGTGATRKSRRTGHATRCLNCAPTWFRRYSPNRSGRRWSDRWSATYSSAFQRRARAERPIPPAFIAMCTLSRMTQSGPHTAGCRQRNENALAVSRLPGSPETSSDLPRRCAARWTMS
jgi:hypothetical protein